MSKKFGNRSVSSRLLNMRDRLSLSRERKMSQSLKVRPTSYEKPKLNSSLPEISAIESNAKFYLYTDGDVQVDIQRPANKISEMFQYLTLMPSWENHHIYLDSEGIIPDSTTGTSIPPIPYGSIEKLSIVSNGPSNCVKILTNAKSYLFQAPGAYQRDRLYVSLQWRMKVHKTTKVLYSTTYPEAMVFEIESLVSMTLGSALFIEDTHRILLDLASMLLTQKSDMLSGVLRENLIVALKPLLEENQPSTAICDFFIKHCLCRPRSVIVVSLFTPIVQQILKHPVDFGKSTWLRDFIMEYIVALNSQNNGLENVRSFIQTMHGPLSQCPHPRILNNLIAVCLSAVYQYYTGGAEDYCKIGHGKSHKVEPPKRPNYLGKSSVVTEKNVLNNEKRPPGKSDLKNMKNKVQESLLKQKQDPDDGVVKPLNTEVRKRGDVNLKQYYTEVDKRPTGITDTSSRDDVSKEDFANISLFIEIINEMSKFDDWCPGLAGVLQPLPFPDQALRSKKFIRLMYPVIDRFAGDDRENVITCLLYSREGKDGWMQVFSPGGNRCEDGGKLYLKIVEALAKQSGKIKKFLSLLASTQLQVIITLALRENPVVIKILRDMLHFGIVKKEQEQLQVVSALRCTPSGNEAYEELRSLLSVFNQNEGPTEFTLAPNSTDKDLTTLLGTGSWGNLVKLDLSFTHVTSEVARLLIHLPNLKRLNLWSTNFDDEGLQMLCDSPINLTALNLCETLVTDEGISCLEVMTNLQMLNLNSTGVKSSTFLHLKKTLPSLQAWDVNYTEAMFESA